MYMPIIRFAKNYPEIEVASGSILMESLLKSGMPVASSCNGDGVCAKCRVIILEGMKNLSPVGDVESFLRERYRLAREIRISCQTRVMGDIRIDTTYW